MSCAHHDTGSDVTRNDRYKNCKCTCICLQENHRDEDIVSERISLCDGQESTVDYSSYQSGDVVVRLHDGHRSYSAPFLLRGSPNDTELSIIDRKTISLLFTDPVHVAGLSLTVFGATKVIVKFFGVDPASNFVSTVKTLHSNPLHGPFLLDGVYR